MSWVDYCACTTGLRSTSLPPLTCPVHTPALTLATSLCTHTPVVLSLPPLARPVHARTPAHPCLYHLAVMHACTVAPSSTDLKSFQLTLLGNVLAPPHCLPIAVRLVALALSN
ncbi:hypothetical protein JVT61DRAFT_10400 [Boletus reticuloceps]|uniref:Uncharacterized protein n=1 Tax=Boletus reticuloceps TaxID=495285 RepID=A0A8I2YZF3_9AGAM|nr:hypothetical protein JVT61DRAFT_10400 [Boletus reticuloceps]